MLLTNRNDGLVTLTLSRPSVNVIINEPALRRGVQAFLAGSSGPSMQTKSGAAR